MGREDPLLRLHTHFRNENQITTHQLLLGAEILESNGRHAEALEWIEAMQRDGSEPAYDRKALLKAVELHKKLGWQDPGAIVAIARESLANHPVSLTRSLAESAFRAGAGEEAVSILKLLRRQTSDRAKRSAISSQLIWLRTELGETPGELAGEWEAYFQDFVYEFDEKAVADSIPWSNAAHFVEWIVRQDTPAEPWEALFESVPTSRESEWLKRLARAYFAGELDTVAASLLSDSGDITRHRLLETLPAFGEPGVAAARRWVDDSGLPGTRFFHHDPIRQISFFHRIEDRARLLEVHQNLMREAESDLFHQTGLDPWFPTLNTRYRLPGFLARIGERDLAARLFDRYHADIHTYLWNHQAFLESYLTFLIEESRYEPAESILKRVVQKTIRVDLRLIMNLYERWGKLDEWEERLSDVRLSTGRLALLRDWRNALAEGGEMVEYTDPW